jgi:hypothetical protein
LALSSSQGLLVQVGAGNTGTTVPTEPAPWEMLSGPGDALA